MQLQIFKYEEDEDHLDDLTAIEIDGEAWFIAVEVCKMLDIENVTNAIKVLDDDEKLPFTLERAGQKRQVNLISESGLYALVFKSKKPSAKKFRKWVTKEVIPAIRKTGVYGIDRSTVPNFVRRYNDNWEKIERGYFSVIGELFVRLYGKFERIGYCIPNKAFDEKEIRPDVSVGLLFSKYLQKNYPEIADDFKTYSHKFPNGTSFDARQYPNTALHIFISFVDDVWIPNNAQEYFKKRDPLALDYLPKLL